MKRLVMVLLLLTMMVTAVSAEGIFDGLVPDVTSPLPTATSVPAPEEVTLPLLLQEEFVSRFGLPEIVQTDEGTVLRYTDFDMPRFAAFAAMLTPEGLRLIQYDIRAEELLVLFSPESVPPSLPAAADGAKCSLCQDWGKCRTCWSLGEIDCTACWDGTCRWCIDGYVYQGRGQKVDCSRCHGSEQCHVCMGEGSFDCPDCLDGLCPACGGSRYQ